MPPLCQSPYCEVNSCELLGGESRYTYWPSNQQHLLSPYPEHSSGAHTGKQGATRTCEG